MSFELGMGECWHGMANEGVMTLSVRDMAGVLDSMQGVMPGDPYAVPTPARPYAEEVGRDSGKLHIGLMH